VAAIRKKIPVGLQRRIADANKLHLRRENGIPEWLRQRQELLGRALSETQTEEVMSMWKPKDEADAHTEGERLQPRMEEADQRDGAFIAEQLEAMEPETLEEEARRTEPEALEIAERMAEAQARAWAARVKAEDEANVDGEEPEEGSG